LDDRTTGDMLGILLISSLVTICLVVIGFSNTFYIAAAAAVHELVTNDTDKTNDMTNATINLSIH